MKKYKAFAKVNIFLKITATRGDYHEIISRFMRIDSLYDELFFTPKQTKEFEIVGEFSCTTQQNTIYKAYIALSDFLQNPSQLKEFFQAHAINVKKSIPAFAGLGGGSSDAATFLKMCNEVLALGLTLEELAKIGLKVGADVPFFIYGYDSANVGGIGEIVEKFDEALLDIETYTPKVEISTPKVYQSYRKNFFNPINATTTKELKETSSLKILNTMTPLEANDLFAPALKEYSELKSHHKEGYHFSGSGSSFFYINKDN
jgi:4-diphosphocytidyl-2-C-methyl-D-erythritol kinase